MWMDFLKLTDPSSPCLGDRFSLILWHDFIATSPALNASRDVLLENGMLFAYEEYICFLIHMI